MSEKAVNSGLRTWRARLIQTAAYEVGGVVLIAPIVASTTDHGLGDSTLFVIFLSLVFLVWSFIHNFAFDLIENKLGYGPASSRSHRWRIVHAICLEVTSIVATLPVIMRFGGFGLWEAVAVDLGLSAAYAMYAYVFHLGFDRLYPVKRVSS